MIKKIINGFSKPNESESSIYVRYLTNRYKLFFQIILIYLLLNLNDYLVNGLIFLLIFLLTLLVTFSINLSNVVFDYKEMPKPNNIKQMVFSHIKLIFELTIVLMVIKCVYNLSFKPLSNGWYSYLIYLIPIISPYLIADIIPMIMLLINKINSFIIKIFNKV